LLRKKPKKGNKTRKFYNPWQDKDETYSNISSKKDGELKLYLMVGYKFSSSNISTKVSKNENNYNIAFKRFE